MGIIYTLITSLNKVGKILTDETIEKRAQDKLFEVPSINGTAYLNWLSSKWLSATRLFALYLSLLWSVFIS
jgi:hypothetical protein